MKFLVLDRDLDVNERIQFPDPKSASRDGIVCLGANLSPGVLLSAYGQGVFPWFSPGDPILWHSPNPRYVLLPAHLHLSKSLRRAINGTSIQITTDRAFGQVIRQCAQVPRPEQDGTWITESMVDAYCALHDHGFAHSVEAWEGEVLVGGLYGVAIGSVFFGESMFALKADASKIAFVWLVLQLRTAGCTLIDSQVHTKHLQRFGAAFIERREYLRRLQEGCRTSLTDTVWGRTICAPAASILKCALSYELA